MAHTPPAETSAPPAPATKKDRTHWLYIAVIASVAVSYTHLTLPTKA